MQLYIVLAPDSAECNAPCPPMSVRQCPGHIAIEICPYFNFLGNINLDHALKNIFDVLYTDLNHFLKSPYPHNAIYYSTAVKICCSYKVGSLNY